MNQVIRIVLVVMSVFFVVMGLRFMAMPEAAAADIFIEAQGIPRREHRQR